jgi:hypothetical protein
MTKTDLRKEIEKIAKEENCGMYKACQAMLGAAAKMKSEEMLEAILEIRREFLPVSL